MGARVVGGIGGCCMALIFLRRMDGHDLRRFTFGDFENLPRPICVGPREVEKGI